MTKSVHETNRRNTKARIVECAQDLAEERGVDGFTMDDLADAAGVSRRTLFNHVPGKLDAILGTKAPDPSLLVEFRAGGPTGRLADDVKTTIAGVLEDKGSSPEEWQRVRRLIASDARLFRAMHDNLAAVVTVLADAIAEREGSEFDRFGAQAAATVTLSLLDVALEAVIEDANTSLADYYRAAFDQAAALFKGAL